MSTRQNIFSGFASEKKVGYARAIKIGNACYVAGTTAWDQTGKIVGVGDFYAQARQTLRNIENALKQAGFSFKDVIRTRIFLKDIKKGQGPVGRAHFEALGDVFPVSTMVEITGLAHPDMLVEIEVDAVKP